jgi:sugar phosphate isomerase/epimerase
MDRNEPVSRRELLVRAAAGAAMLGGVIDPARAETQTAKPKKEAPRKMHLGIVTYNVARDWDLPTLLRVCKEAGIEGVEFRTTHKHGIEPSLSQAQRAEIRKQCADAGLLQMSMGSICEFHSPDPAVVQHNIDECRRFVDLAADIGARGVKVRPNNLPPDVPVDKTVEQIGKALIECGRIGSDRGIEIWMEVHGSHTSDPKIARQIMDHCGHPNVGVTWNSNGTDVVDGSVRQSFDLLHSFIRCCHITDLWSNYPYRELFGLLKRGGYDRFMLCEVGTPVHAEDGTLFLRCYRKLWEELGR